MIIGSLCTGYGGLDMAAEAVFGATVGWTADIDPGASKIIGYRYPDVPNLGDFTKTDWSTVTPIDILTAGWPCQPFSQAGKQKGAADARAIWPAVARAVRDLRPRYVVLENVSAIATVRTGPELARAVADLAAIGYVGSWCCVRAADVGAPHRRERLFIVATDARRVPGDQGRCAGPAEAPGGRPFGEPAGCDRAPVALLPTPKTTDDRTATRGDVNRHQPGLRALPLLLPTPTATPYGNNQSSSPGAAVRPPLDGVAQLLPTPTTEPTTGNGHARNLGGEAKLLPTPRAADGPKGAVSSTSTTDRRVRNGQANLPEFVLSAQFGQYAAAVARWTPIIGRPAPDPTIPGRNGGRRLNPRFVEWMMGIPDGHVTDVPDLTIPQQLKALGNGVVPLQAETAICYLLNRSAVAA